MRKVAASRQLQPLTWAATGQKLPLVAGTELVSLRLESVSQTQPDSAGFRCRARRRKLRSAQAYRPRQ